jgi:RND family efflux transporter MFP subunit
MTRILLVDDQVLLCEVLQTWLESQEDFQVVGRAHNGQTAISQVEALLPDIVLMDIEMPVMNGITATEIICRRFPDTKIIVLTVSEDRVSLAHALRAGAQGYLLKSTQAVELVNIIRFVERGYHQIEPNLLKKIVTEIPVSTDSLLESDDASQSQLSLSPQKDCFVPYSQVFESESVSLELARSQLKSEELNQRQKSALEVELLNSSSKAFVSDRHNEPNAKESILVDLKAEKSTKRPEIKKIVLLSCMTLLLILGSLVFLKQRDRPTIKPKPAKVSQEANVLAVKTIAIERVNSYGESRFYTGTIAASRTSELGFEQPGQLIRILVDEGDRVSAGSPLAYLDSQSLKISRLELLAQKAQAVAKLQEMQAGARAETIASAEASVRDLSEQLELARQKSQRRKELYVQGAISREQFDQTKSDRAVLQARLDKAKSELDELIAGVRAEQIAAQKSLIEQYDAKIATIQLQLQKNVLKAPFSATISRRLLDEGTVVSAGQPIVRLVENKALEARIGVPTSAVAQIPLGSYQRLKIGQKIYRAKVSSILPELDASTRTHTVVLTLDESPGKEVSPGQVARLEFAQIIGESGYWLPTTALVQGMRGLWSCYVLGKTDRSKYIPVNKIDAFPIERRDVEVLHTESDRVLVRGTIQEGDRVIVGGTHRLVSGQLVRPITNQ